MTPNNLENRKEQIAKIHLLAYSREHFTSSFNLNKLIEYNQKLVDASDLSLLAIENGEVVGFIIAGKKVSVGVSNFTNENRGWLMWQLIKRPNILFDKIVGMINIRLKPAQPSQAKFRLLSIAIKPGAQGKGCGAEMLNFFERELLSRGVNCYGLSVKNKNSGAIRFYERNGFLKEKEYLGSSYYVKNLDA
jgi:ribosomal protein S18 acetylase RimI-like enzyme